MSDTRVHAYTCKRVKCAKRRFSENIYKPTISDVQTTLKREDVSMPIQKISPGQDLETQLQKSNYQNYSKVSKMHYLLSGPLMLLGIL